MTDLSTVRVHLTPNSQRALHAAAERTGDTQTDTLNRALQVYDLLTQAVSEGARVFVQHAGRDGEALNLREATP